MGYYIEVPGHFDKAEKLIALHGATRLSLAGPRSVSDVGADNVPICVVRNAQFEAAGICYDDQELRVFTDPDDMRPKTWLKMPRQQVAELCPQVAHLIV